MMNKSVKIIALLALNFISPSFAMETKPQPRSLFSYIIKATKKVMGNKRQNFKDRYGITMPEKESFFSSIAKKLSFSNLLNLFTNKPVNKKTDPMSATKKYEYSENLNFEYEQGKIVIQTDVPNEYFDNGAGAFNHYGKKQLLNRINKSAQKAKQTPVNGEEARIECLQEIDRLTKKRIEQEQKAMLETHWSDNELAKIENTIMNIETQINRHNKNLNSFI